MSANGDKEPQLPTSRFMKRMILLDAVTLICILIAAYIGIWFGKNMDTWLVVGCGAFSVELGYTAWIKLSEIKSRSNGKQTNEKTATKKVNG